MFNKELYDMVTDFSNKYGCHKFNDENNHNAYMSLVNECVKFGNIPKRNSEEFSTHGRLTAAIAYESNRYKFCTL